MENNMLIEQKREYYAAISNEIVQKSIFSVNAQQFDLLIYVISMVKKGDAPDTIYKFSLKEFCQLCNKDYKNGWYYVTVKQDLKAIADVSAYIPIGIGRNGKVKERLFRWFNRVETDNGGNFEVSFHYSIYPYIFDLTEKYSMATTKYIYPLGTFVSKRLYLELRSYQISPDALRKEYIKAVEDGTIEEWRTRERKVIRTLDLEELRRQLACDKYDRYVDFSRYVIEKAVNEINRFTDIEVSYKGVTSKGSGKRITGVEFTIKLINRSFYDDDRARNREIFYYDEAREAHTDDKGNIIWHTMEDGKVKHIEG